MPRDYYWLVARDENGNRYLIYGGETEEEAQQRGFEMLGTRFEIKAFPTKDQNRASSMLKGNILEETSNLKQATKRLKHTRITRRKNNNDYNS